MSNAIDVVDLVVKYRSRQGKAIEAVNGLSFSVDAGEVVGFLGPNGAGKSSTLKALMGFVEPAAGICQVFGMPGGSTEAKRRIGYLPEVALYYPFLTPLETLTLYGELQGLKGRALRQEASDLLALVGLQSAMRKQNRTLSKGMLQRVGIAQSLLGNPELLILDEVTSGLDPIGRKELRDILLARRAAGATLFFSSHELAEVEMLCDRVLLIQHGKLIEERSVANLKEELRQFVLVFEGKAPISDSAAEIERLESGAWRATFQSKPALIDAIGKANEAKATILDVVSQEGSLEDYFVESVRRAA